MKSINFQILIFISLFLLANKINAQCVPAAPAIAACSGGNGAGSNGVNINSGQTFWFTGGPTTWPSGINLNGGTFRVCGNLTLNSINFNSGTIIIESGGSLTINLGGGNLYLNGNSSICNRGTFNLNGSLRMQNTNNTIWNIGSGASFNVTGVIEINSATSKIINNAGSITAGSILVQGSASAGAICMQNGSCFTFNGGSNSIINNFTNAWTFSGTGTAAVTYNGNAQLNNAFTASSNIIICRNAGATTSGGGGWGAATLANTPCPNCSVALPIELLYFNAIICNNSVCFNWATASEFNNNYFTIEYSENAIDFNSLARIEASGNSTSKIKYHKNVSLNQFNSNSTILYFRLKQTDYDGQVSYSEIIALNIDKKINEISIYPNPFMDEINITNKNSCVIEIMNNGFSILNKVLLENSKTVIETKSFPSGIYFVLIKDEVGRIIHTEKLVK
jgi:hypothetical protein